MPFVWKSGVLRRLYDWTLAQAERKNAIWVLAGVSFIESSFFPIPPDILLIPMVLAAPTRAWWIAFVCTAASVAGGIFGYGIGFFLYDTIGRQVFELYGYAEKFAFFQDGFNEHGAWIVFIAGLTPFPYKVITIASGVTQLDLIIFTIASIISRGLRFFIVAALLWYFGAWIRQFIDRYFGILTVVFVILLIGGFAALKLI